MGKILRPRVDLELIDGVKSLYPEARELDNASVIRWALGKIIGEATK